MKSLPARRILPADALAAWVVVALVACSSGDDEEPIAAGDVVAACTTRSAWTRSLEGDCLKCIAYAQSPACECPDINRFPMAAACERQADARRVEPTCTVERSKCVAACRASDCACVAGCYAGADACRAAVGALDACVVDACAPLCR